MPLCCVVPVAHNGLVETTVSNHSIPCSQSLFLPLCLITCPSLLIRHVVWMLSPTLSPFSAQFHISALCALSQTLFRFMGEAPMGRRQSWKGSVLLFWISEMKFITNTFRSPCLLCLWCAGDNSAPLRWTPVESHC